MTAYYAKPPYEPDWRIPLGVWAQQFYSSDGANTTAAGGARGEDNGSLLRMALTAWKPAEPDLLPKKR